MAKFKFRLQTVHDLRVRQEDEAKSAYLQARARQVEAEAWVDGAREMLTSAARRSATDIDELRALDLYLSRLEDELRAGEAALGVVVEDTQTHQDMWLAAKRDREAMTKLRDKRHDEWVVNENRREQAELDEWSVLRRSA